MGVNIAAINMEWLVDYLEKNISEIKGDYICVSNVHTTVTCFEDADYCAIQNGGLMAIPDGGPLSTVGQKRGHKNMERTTGPSLMGEIFEISAKKEYRHYFYGSKEETLELLYPVYSGRGLHCICRAGQESVSLVWRERQQECSHRVQPAEWYGVEASDPHPAGDGLH